VIGTAYWVQSQISREQQMVVEMQQNLRSAVYFLERDIMMAGYDGNPNDAINATIKTATPAAFSFQFVDDTNIQNTVAYVFYDALGDGDFDLGRAVNGGLPAAVAENIEQIEFFYTLADGRQSNDPTTLAPPGNSPADIRTVGIAILARTASETRAIDNAIYTSLSGGTIGPYNDGFKRQLVTATIMCRNMN
jgi:type IV pilus assembly protein PilW